jgi:hypothetical protein
VELLGWVFRHPYVGIWSDVLVLALSSGCIPPGEIRCSESDSCLARSVGEYRKLVELVGIHFTIAGNRLDYPEPISSGVPKEDIWHCILESDLNASLSERTQLLTRDTLSISFIEKYDLEAWEEAGDIDLRCDAKLPWISSAKLNRACKRLREPSSPWSLLGGFVVSHKPNSGLVTKDTSWNGWDIWISGVKNQERARWLNSVTDKYPAKHGRTQFRKLG